MADAALARTVPELCPVIWGGGRTAVGCSDGRFDCDSIDCVLPECPSPLVTEFSAQPEAISDPTSRNLKVGG